MTENKRFTVKQRQGATIYSINDYYGELPLSEGMYYKSNAEKLCKWLNNQHDLLNAFYKENEQLKQTNQKLYDNLQETIGHLALKSGIEKENEQLNKSRDELISENRHIKKTIQTMLINERTAIGKSVLKQLWNAIHME